MAHIHEKIDFTASVYIVKDDHILLHKHKKLGRWLQPGGHIELDEDPNQAALREVKEETGFDVELFGGPRLPAQPTDGTHDLIPPRFLNRHNFAGTNHEHVDFSYFGRVIGGEMKPEDGVEMRWVSREEIEQQTIQLNDVTRSYSLAALDYFAQQQ